MLDTRKDNGNDVIVAPFVFLFLTRAILARDSPSNFNGSGRQNCGCYCKKISLQ